MNKLCAFICLVVVFTGNNHLISQTATFNVSADFTGTGVVVVDSSTATEFAIIDSSTATEFANIVVDSSTATEFANISDPAMDAIVDVIFTANVSSSSSSINSDGTINSSGGSPFNNELGLTLISPTGTSLELIGTGTFFGGANGDAFELLDISFADGGAPLGPNPPTGGTFAATGGAFDIFNGEFAGGAWQIVIQDTVGADPKSLNGFSLTVVTAVPEPSSAFFMALGLVGVATLRRRTAGC